MSIVSFWFFIYVAVSVLVYYLVPKPIRWVVLLIGSTIFFVLGCSVPLFLMFAAQVVFAWGGTLLIQRQRKSNLKNVIGTVVIFTELAALIAMKENSFFITNGRILVDLLSISIHIPDVEWVAPLGISYYTLLLVSYTIDVMWGHTEVQKNPLKLMLYAGFFPQMVSGPFTRYGEINNNLYQGNTFSYQQFCFGIQRFFWGLFKKLVLAERLAVLVSTIYGGGLEGTQTFTGVYIFIGALSYVFQLYTDFSGCMDIVIGTAQMFGVILPENFNTPFYSTSLSEFWRRWHITLGIWLKEYVLYSVLKSKFTTKIRNFCKNRHFSKKLSKGIPTYFGMLVTWFCIGFWHGGSWKYICSSGLFFFIMIVGGLLLEPVFEHLVKILRINRESWSWKLFQRLRTIMLFTFSVSFGRAKSLTDGFQMWGRASEYNPWVLFDGSLYKLGLDMKDFWVLIYGLFILFVVSWFQQRGSVRERILKQNIAFRWVLWLSLFVAVLLFGMYGEGYNPSDFIYGGF